MNTTKKIIATILVFVLFYQANAQLGARLGANLAKFSVNNDIEQSSKFGISLGAYLKVNLAGNIYIQPEFNLTQQGTKESTDDDNYSAVTVNYMQIPILLKFVFGDAEKLNFFVEGGPYFSKGIGKIKLKDCINGNCETDKINFEDVNFNLKKSDVGLMLGAGANLTRHLMADIRVGLGISNISEIQDYDIRNTAINFGIGYTL